MECHIYEKGQMTGTWLVTFSRVQPVLVEQASGRAGKGPCPPWRLNTFRGRMTDPAADARLNSLSVCLNARRLPLLLRSATGRVLAFQPLPAETPVCVRV